MYRGFFMTKANFDLPEDTLKKVCQLSGSKTKKQAIVIALDAYIQQKKIEALISKKGKISLNWTKSSLRKYRNE